MAAAQPCAPQREPAMLPSFYHEAVEKVIRCCSGGHEYASPAKPQHETRERACPRCKPNSVRKIPSPKWP